jgi:putative oxidoreductase
MAITVSTGLLILRLVAGLTLAAHGAQKLFGWFGGGGIKGTLQMQERMGLKPAPLWAGMVLLGEFGGGLSLALGFLTPLGAAAMIGTMFMAIAKAHWKNGFWNGKRGIEFPLQLLTIGVVLGIAGPGSYSLDTLFGITLPGVLFLILALAALLVDVAGLFISRGTVVAPAQPAPVGASSTSKAS